MCGIVGAVAQRNVVPILIEGLRKLEYRGYDSAGIAMLHGFHHLVVGQAVVLPDNHDRYWCHTCQRPRRFHK